MSWSLATEEPPELPVTMVSLSRGGLTIAHPGDAVHPAVLVPLEAEQRSSSGFIIPYESFDPERTAKVSLSVSPRFDGSESTVIASNLPATPRGEFSWSTVSFAKGRYSVRAEITDARGLSFANYGRFYLTVDPPVFTEDAGPTDVPAPDGDETDLETGNERTPVMDAENLEHSASDAGDLAPTDPASCRCLHAKPSISGGLSVLLLFWLASRRRFLLGAGFE